MRVDVITYGCDMREHNVLCVTFRRETNVFLSHFVYIGTLSSLAIMMHRRLFFSIGLFLILRTRSRYKRENGGLQT